MDDYDEQKAPEEDEQHPHRVRTQSPMRRKTDKFWRGAALVLALAGMKVYSAYEAQHDDVVRSAISRSEAEDIIRIDLQGMKDQIEVLKRDNALMRDDMRAMKEDQTKIAVQLAETAYYYHVIHAPPAGSNIQRAPGRKPGAP